MENHGKIIADIDLAMAAQKRKFGAKAIATDGQYSHILGEEFGEVCRGVNQNDQRMIYKESIQCIAVIMAYLEGDLHYGQQA